MSRAGSVSGGYFPVYPQHDALPDPEIRTMITNFYRISDRPDANELWVSYFTKDAQVTMGNDVGRGQDEIRALRTRMWTAVEKRTHTVEKVFPAQFQGSAEDGQHGGKVDGSAGACEAMLFGSVSLKLRDGGAATVPWAGHAVLRREKDGERTEWKFAQYRVWLQR